MDNDKVLESFISYCDDMKVGNEGFIRLDDYKKYSFNANEDDDEYSLFRDTEDAIDDWSWDFSDKITSSIKEDKSLYEKGIDKVIMELNKDISNIMNNIKNNGSIMKYFGNYRALIQLSSPRVKKSDKDIIIEFDYFNNADAKKMYEMMKEKAVKDNVKTVCVPKYTHIGGIISGLFEDIIKEFIQIKYKSLYNVALNVSSNFCYYPDEKNPRKYDSVKVVLNIAYFNDIVSQTSLSEDIAKEQLLKYIEDFNTLMKEKGFSSGKKTYNIHTDYMIFEKKSNRVNVYNDNYQGIITYNEFDDVYSGTNSDYNNGLTKEDLKQNKLFIQALSQVLIKLKNEYPNIKTDDDVYRGHGSINFSIYEAK